MRKFAIIFILLVVSFCLFAKKTEIIVIGTVHQPTKNYSTEDLANIFHKVKPNIILIEWPVNWFEGNGIEKLKKMSKDNPGLERSATLKYLDNNKYVQLRYYDIKNRNKFYQDKDYFKQEDAFMSNRSKLYQDKKLSETAKLLFDQEINVYQIRDGFGAEYPRVINSEACDAALSIKQEVTKNNDLELTKIVPELKEHNNFIIMSNNFWDKRNHSMVKNILNYSKQYQGKKIAVLCGFEHRYYLRKLLKEAEKSNNIVLKEYWEY